MKLNQSVFGTLSAALVMNLFAASAFSADACKPRDEVQAGDDAAKVVELNKIMKETLASFNNEATVSDFTFKRLATDPTRVTDIQISAGFAKIGGKKDLALKLGNLEYSNVDPTCAVPYVSFDVSAEYDVLQFIDQASINEFAPQLEQLAQEAVKNATAEFGEALNAAVKVDSIEKDANGNVVSVSVTAAGELDMAKLPAHIAAEDVMFTEASVGIVVGVKGLRLNATVVLNPKHRAFGKDEPGMKEYINKVLARSEAEINEIKSAFQQLEDLYKQINP